jgi:hypothetical protein
MGSELTTPALDIARLGGIADQLLRRQGGCT